MMVVAVQTTPTFSPGTPTKLFDGPWAALQNGRTYDVSPDGEHFVMLNSGEEDRAVTQISVLLNWFEELKARVPTK